MHNQIEQFFKKLDKLSINGSEYFSTQIGNANSDNKVLDDFKKTYNTQEGFKKDVSECLPALLYNTEKWQVLISKNKEIIYSTNYKFTRTFGTSLYLIKDEKYLLELLSSITPPSEKELREQMQTELERLKKINTSLSPNASKMQFEDKDYFILNSVNEFNAVENLIKELKTHEVEIDGKKYYLITQIQRSEFKKDVDEFYGKHEDLENLLFSFNYSDDFRYTCLINAETNKYEIVFNDLFAKYDASKKALEFYSFDTVLANRTESIKNEAKPKPIPSLDKTLKSNNSSLPPPPANPPGMPPGPIF